MTGRMIGWDTSHLVTMYPSPGSGDTQFALQIVIERDQCGGRQQWPGLADHHMGVPPDSKR